LRCGRGEDDKGARRSYDNVGSNYEPRGTAILFKSATRRNTGKAAQRVLRHGLSSLAPINSRELNERMRSASTYDPPTLNRSPPAPLLLLSFAERERKREREKERERERVPFLSGRVSLSRATARAHFWGFVGFLIKGAAVTPTARMRGIVRGISSKNLPPVHRSRAYPFSRRPFEFARRVI